MLLNLEDIEISITKEKELGSWSENKVEVKDLGQKSITTRCLIKEKIEGSEGNM